MPVNNKDKVRFFYCMSKEYGDFFPIKCGVLPVHCELSRISFSKVVENDVISFGTMIAQRNNGENLYNQLMR